jgi:hypothetical protein
MQLIARTESPIQSGYRLQARDQEMKLTSALDESHPKSAQSLASEAAFSMCATQAVIELHASSL